MSLINQMLRDLEHRRTGGSPDGSLLRQVRVTHRRLPRFWLAGVMLAIGSGFLLTFWLAPALRPSPAVKAAPEPILLQLAVMPAVAPPADEAPVERWEDVLPAADPISWPPEPPAVPAPAPAVAANPSSLAAAAAVATAPADPAGEMTRVIRAPAPAEAAERELRAGRSAWERGDLVQAEERLRQALVLAPEQLAARESLAQLLHQRGQRTEADELLQAGLELAPRHSPFLKGRARLLVEGGAWPQARELLSRYPAPLPATDPEYSALLAAICQQLGDWPAAVDLYHRLLAVHPTQGTWWVGLAIAQEGEGNPAEAAHSYRRGLEVGSLPQELAQYARNRLNSGL